MKTLFKAMLGLALAGASTSLAMADPIEGLWLRPSTNTLVKYEKKGAEYCGTVQSGQYQGQSIGCLAKDGQNYKGKVIALDEGKTYTGKASVAGNIMNLKGCVGIFCKGEDWKRQ